MQFSEKCYRKFHMGEVDFIPVLNNIAKMWELWKLVINVREGNKINRLCIKRNFKSLVIRRPMSHTL